jgi:hypothetical protein
MATHGSGCRHQDKGFSVYMNTHPKKESKCLRCKKYTSSKCKICEFEDRGFILVDRRER